MEASDLDQDSLQAPFEGRFPVNAGISGYVAATGETVNIVDAYDDERFDQAVDAGSDFVHRDGRKEGGWLSAFHLGRDICLFPAPYRLLSTLKLLKDTILFVS